MQIQGGGPRKFKNVWDHWNNQFKQWKSKTIFETEYVLFNFFLQATTYIGTIEMPIGTKNLDTKPAVGTS